MSIKATQPEDSAVKKMTPGDDLHLTLLGVPMGWNFLIGQDRAEMLAYGRAVWNAALTTPSPQPAEAKTAAVDGMTDAIQWPKTRDVGRTGDMTPVRQSVLRIGLDSDNDVYVNLWDSGPNGRIEEYQNASIEFCNGGGGGGKSPRTRAALINLMSAIEADNAADSSRAWPFERAAIATQEGGR